MVCRSPTRRGGVGAGDCRRGSRISSLQLLARPVAAASRCRHDLPQSSPRSRQRLTFSAQAAIGGGRAGEDERGTDGGGVLQVLSWTGLGAPSMACSTPCSPSSPPSAVSGRQGIWCRATSPNPPLPLSTSTAAATVTCCSFVFFNLNYYGFFNYSNYYITFVYVAYEFLH
uniref:Uncharacterized protein n=1 Tax=Leersia perrieri TaxID=77586 RepID=A0A0D9V301_9ORYZ